ncbi:syntaxin-7-like isoform X2 [Anneissia japonica]|uniref:syntaxin-7-like isoform X1 n=1 Tax=Anneissia japonica TaxID=1529436 RepID=UPI0014256460|nr:syntaxin-7-like isoform X1 [Anneissia japonica]XP_033126131.1 syntaxin-7-like isoform X2 [Anneissia japonica]
MASYGKGDFGSEMYDASYINSGGRSNTSDFNRLSQVIGSNIQKINTKVSEVQRMVDKLGTREDDHDLRTKLDEVQHFTNQLAKETNSHLKDMASLSLSGQDTRQARMQKERLTNDFSTALNQFQRVQREAAQRQRECVNRVRASSGLGTSANPYEDNGHNEDLLGLGGSGTTTSQVMFQEDDLESLQEREAQLKKLESDILDVNHIFKDLAHIVHEQGEMIDSIEANVESAEIHVEEANVQLHKARDYQKKSRKKMCCIFIFCIVLLGIIALVLYLTLKP